MDRELYETASGMDGLQFCAFAQILRSAAQVFKAGAVGVSTGFGVTDLLRDYTEYQGRAEHVKGRGSLGKPIEMVARYIGYKAPQKAGLPTDDALIETFEAAGGKLFTRLGSDIATRQRTRERKIGKAGHVWPLQLFSMLRLFAVTCCQSRSSRKMSGASAHSWAVGTPTNRWHGSLVLGLAAWRLASA